MPDREKYIEVLSNTAKAVKEFNEDIPIKISLKCIEDILELMKEQEAKPVIVTTNAYGTRFYHCPKCNHDLYVYPRQLYCSNCGQKVKWE